MVAGELLLFVPGPVGVEVAVAAQGAKLQDGLGAGQAPAGPGDVEAVFDLSRSKIRFACDLGLYATDRLLVRL